MSHEELVKLSDEELLKMAANNKPNPLFDAFFIGFLIGIVFFSVAYSTWGLVTLIPLYLIHLFLKKPGRHKALMEELNKRGLQ
jgi:hypothetical protein